MQEEEGERSGEESDGIDDHVTPYDPLSSSVCESDFSLEELRASVQRQGALQPALDGDIYPKSVDGAEARRLQTARLDKYLSEVNGDSEKDGFEVYDEKSEEEDFRVDEPHPSSPEREEDDDDEDEDDEYLSYN